MKYDHIFIFGAFNWSVKNSHLQSLTKICNLTGLINEPTSFPPHDATCVDNFLTNQKAVIELIRLFETGLSDQHKLISIVMKSGIFRLALLKKADRSDKTFDLEHFNIVLKRELESLCTFQNAECTFQNITIPETNKKELLFKSMMKSQFS